MTSLKIILLHDCLSKIKMVLGEFIKNHSSWLFIKDDCGSWLHQRSLWFMTSLKIIVVHDCSSKIIVVHDCSSKIIVVHDFIKVIVVHDFIKDYSSWLFIKDHSSWLFIKDHSSWLFIIIMMVYGCSPELCALWLFVSYTVLHPHTIYARSLMHANCQIVFQSIHVVYYTWEIWILYQGIEVNLFPCFAKSIDTGNY